MRRSSAAHVLARRTLAQSSSTGRCTMPFVPREVWAALALRCSAKQLPQCLMRAGACSILQMEALRAWVCCWRRRANRKHKPQVV